MKKYWIICTIYCWYIYDSPSIVIAQEFFAHLTVEDGLSSNSVYNIFQDSEGYIWFATISGLNRYDGERVRVFLPDIDDPDAMTFSSIRCITEDHQGNLWIGGREGKINEFRKKENRFIEYRQDSTSKTATSPIWELFCDHKGKIWVASTKYIGTIDHESRQIVPFTPKQPKDYQTIYDEYNLFSVSEDIDDPNILWFGMYKPNVLKLNIQTETFKLKNVASSTRTRYKDIEMHPNGSLYYYTPRNHIGAFDTRTEKTKLYDVPDEINANALQCLTKSDTELWFGTRSNGLGVLNTESGHMDFIRHHPSLKWSILEGSNYSLMEDQAGDLWVGSDVSGVSKLENNLVFFEHHFNDKNKRVKKTRDFIENVQYLDNGDFLTTSYLGDKIARVDGALKEIEKRLPGKLDANTAFIQRIFRLADDRILCTGRHGMAFLDPFSFDLSTPNSIVQVLPNSATCFGMIKDDKGNIWSNVKNPSGLLKYNPDQNTADFFEIKTEFRANSVFIPNLMDLDKDGNIWLADTREILIFSSTSQSFSKFDKANWDIPGAEIFDLKIDHDNKVWLAVFGHGLVSLEHANGENAIRNYGMRHGFSTNMVWKMAVDEDNCIWAVTSNGLIRLDQTDQSIKVFTTRDGLVYDHLGYNRKHRIALMDNGEMFIGGWGYFTQFDPRQVPLNSKPPQLVFDSFVIDDDSTIANLNHLDQVRLDYKQSFFEVRFAALNFIHPEKNVYQYKLDGFDDDWHSTYEGKARFTKVPPGNYTFMLKGANNDGVWSETIRSFEIDIKPPFWQTKLFYFAMMTFLSGLIYFLYRRRIEMIKNEEQMKSDFRERLADVEMKALRSQMNPHFIFNSLNSIKSYIAKNESRLATDYLSKFAQLMRLILSNSDQKTVSLAQELKAIELYIQLEQMRFTEQFEYTIHIDPAIGPESLQVQPLILQPFVENAIWHGLLHKEGPGRLDIRIERVNGEVQFEIEDNGIGRAVAGELKSKSAIRKKSYGLSITNERIKHFNRSAGVEIIDLGENGRATGTLVRITWPIASGN